MIPQQGPYEWHLSLIHKVSGCPAATDGGGHVLGNRLPCSWLWQARPPVQSLHVAMSAPRILSVCLIGLNFAFVLHHLFLWIVTLGWLVLHYHPFVLLVWASSLWAVTHSSDRQGYTLNEPTPITIAFTTPPMEGCQMTFLTKSAQQPIPLSPFFLVAHDLPRKCFSSFQMLIDVIVNNK